MTGSQRKVSDLAALAGLAPELASTFASLSSDIALVIGADGVIRNAAMGEAPIAGLAEQWVGRAFVDTVTQDTRGKIQLLLQEVGTKGLSRRREVNLPGAEGRDIPVAFAAIQLGAGGPVLAVGRDLRAIAAIQQRLVDAQQELESDYWRQRQAESRYRLLFQVATDAVMVVDANTLRIAEANRAAGDLFGQATDQLVGQPAHVGIDPSSRPALDELLITARTSGRPAEIRLRLKARLPSPGLPAVDVSATPFRATVDGASQLLLLVRARAADPSRGTAQRQLAEFVEHTPDAVVITDSSGRVQMANPAFVMLCPQGVGEGRIKGNGLADVLGDPGHLFAQLLAEVRRHGIVRQAGVRIGTVGGIENLPEVEVSAALLTDGDQESIGFTLRRLEPRQPLMLAPVEGLTAAIENLSAQLGRVSLPELMQEASYLAEGHLLRQAMQRARGQAAAAAHWLGITPDSLALRLRRHNLADTQDNSGSSTLLN